MEDLFIILEECFDEGCSQGRENEAQTGNKHICTGDKEDYKCERTVIRVKWEISSMLIDHTLFLINQGDFKKYFP